MKNEKEYWKIKKKKKKRRKKKRKILEKILNYSDAIFWVPHSINLCISSDSGIILTRAIRKINFMHPVSTRKLTNICNYTRFLYEDEVMIWNNIYKSMVYTNICSMRKINTKSIGST
jgi:hypothetical protein